MADTNEAIGFGNDEEAIDLAFRHFEMMQTHKEMLAAKGDGGSAIAPITAAAPARSRALQASSPV